MDKKKLRKRIYVDHAVQGGIVARLIFLWIAFAVLGITVWLTLNYFADPTPGISHYVRNAANHLTPLLFTFAAILPIVILHLLRFTHRFAGPVVRLKRILGELADGDEVPTLKFRDGDYWQELADEFNRVAAVVAEQKQEIARLKTNTTADESSLAESSQPSEPEPVVAG